MCFIKPSVPKPEAPAVAAAPPSASPANPETTADTVSDSLKKKARGKKSLMVGGAGTGGANGSGLNL